MRREVKGKLQFAENKTNFHYFWEGLRVQHSSCGTILHIRHMVLASGNCNWGKW